MKAFNEIMHLPLQRHAETVNAFQQREDPTQGWRRCRLIDLIRHGLLVRGSYWRGVGVVPQSTPATPASSP